MYLQTKKAFTLVELIVVITILAILGTIAFISLQGYSRDARDSVRLSDVKSIKTSLELFMVNTGFYPESTGGVDITYSGATIWTQGTVGDSVVTNLQKLNEKPTDPLTGNEYTYSRLNTKKEYEIGAILEGDFAYNVVIPQANAASVQSYVRGTYNGVVAKVNTGSTDYVLAIPTIITSDLSNNNITDIISNKALAFNGYDNIPAGYEGYTATGGFDYSPSNIVVFEGDTSELSNSGTLLKNFADNIQAAYTGSDIASTGIYADILSMDTSVESEVTNLAGNIVNNNLGGQVVTNTNTSSSVNGVCGSDNGGAFTSEPTNLCTAGTSTGVIDNGAGSTYIWTCTGENGGTEASCSASHSTDVLNYMSTNVWGNGSANSGLWSYNSPSGSIITNDYNGVGGDYIYTSGNSISQEFGFYVSSYGTNCYADYQTGIIKLVYFRDSDGCGWGTQPLGTGVDYISIKDGDTWINLNGENMLGADNKRKYIIDENKNYTLYRNGSVLYSGTLTNFPVSGNYSVKIVSGYVGVNTDYLHIQTPISNSLTYNKWGYASDIGDYFRVTNNNLTVSHLDGSYAGGVRAMIGKDTGKWYFEVTMTSYGNSPSVGVTNQDTMDMQSYEESGVGTVAYWSGNGNLYHNQTNEAYGDAYTTTGDVIGVALDMDNGAIWFSKNGVWQGGASLTEIESGNTTNAAKTGLTGTHYPALGDGSTTGTWSATANFGQSTFDYTVPAGFNAGIYE